MARAVGYIRVSTGGQVESGLGLEAQVEDIQRWAEAEGLPLTATFEDAGISGAAAVDKRPGLLAALSALKRGDVLVVAKRDRLGRSVSVCAIAEEMARRRGARVIAVDSPTNGDDPISAAMRSMIDVFAQLERAMIAARTRAALDAKRRRGEPYCGVGRPPIGHLAAPDGVTLLDNPTEGLAVARITTLRARGLPIREIALALNQEGYPARGRRWYPTTVARVLRRAGGACD